MIETLHRQNRLPQFSESAMKWRFKTGAEVTTTPILTSNVINFASRDIYALGTVTIGGTIVAGNVVNLAISSGSAITVTPSSPTLTGGSTTTRASGSITVSATNVTAGTVASLTINGVKYSYTAASGDTVQAPPGKLAA